IVPAIDDEVMALRFQPDGAVDGGAEQLIVAGGAQRLAQVRGILVAEAGMQRPGAGDPHAVTGLAEVVGHWGDEAELAAGLADANVTSGAAGILVKVGQRILYGQTRAPQRQRYV